MVKLQYLLWPTNARYRKRDDLRQLVMEEIGPALLAAEPTELKLTLTSQRPPRLSVIPFRRTAVALITALVDNGARAKELAELCRRDGLRLGGYRVTESTPVAYGRHWPDGEPTPGVGLLTLFKRKPGLADDEFIERWHRSHTPLTLRIHPVWNYVRNQVDSTVVADSPPFDAIVEEHFRAPEDLLSPARFFNGALEMLPNMARVLVDVRRFIDMKSMETYLVSEVVLKSA